MPFLLITFSVLNSFWFVFCYCFSWKALIISSPWRSLIKCLRHSIFNIFHHENFFTSIWNVNFCTQKIIYWYFNNIINFTVRIFVINFFTRINICAWFYINKLIILIELWCVLFYLLTISSNLSRYTFFVNEVMCL